MEERSRWRGGALVNPNSSQPLPEASKSADKSAPPTCCTHVFHETRVTINLLPSLGVVDGMVVIDRIGSRTLKPTGIHTCDLISRQLIGIGKSKKERTPR